MELDNGVSAIDWDPHSFEVFNSDHVSYESGSFLSLDSSPSTGYLEDAVAEWSNRCKRKRMESYSYTIDQTESDIAHQENVLFQDMWNLDYQEQHFASSFIFETNDDSANSTLSSCPSSSTETKQLQVMPQHHSTPIPYKRQAIEAPISNQSSSSSRKVAYPFEMVKPGAEEGEVTLEEINERILKRPSRPIRHPIGEFACLPNVLSGEGLGLSGKAVVALTRIQTQGSGTITIIRTRG